jgi:hypothetical protein
MIDAFLLPSQFKGMVIALNAAQHSLSVIVAQSLARQRITSNLPFDE